MRCLLKLVFLVIPLTSVMCGPTTAMASPARAPLFVKGQAPHRPMEILGEMVVEMGSASGKKAALEAMRKRAAALGADAVVDVVVESITKEIPAEHITGVPLVVLGSLMSLATFSPDPLKEVVDSARAQVLRRPVTVIRGVAVKYVR